MFGIVSRPPSAVDPGGGPFDAAPSSLFSEHSSLAAQRGAQAIGGVLSGSGSDGTEGLRAIKAEGGITFAQAPPTAEFGAMPQSAITAGVVDTGMPIAALARELVRLGRGRAIQRR